jgi:RNA polymerase sigma factor (sigma-70 family)
LTIPWPSSNWWIKTSRIEDDEVEAAMVGRLKAMPTSPLSVVIQNLLADLSPNGDGMTDRELLARFLRSRDEDALAALVRKHARMVWGVCCRLLHQHDAEDAFQSTFLVLVRKAADVPSEAVANWLYGVARQTAIRLRATAAKRRRRETQVVNMPEPTVPEGRDADLQSVLDEELSRLPDHYRGVIVLCDLEGMTRKVAARQLGIPEGSVASRLARARTMLAKRLTQRGVALSGGALAAVLAQQAVSAGVPNSVVDSTIKAASLFAAGKAATTGAISVKVATLTEGVIKAMLFIKLKSAIAVVLMLGLMATGATLLIYRTAAGQDEKKSTAEKPVEPAAKKEAVGHEAPSKKTEAAKGLKLTLSADKTETRMKPGADYGAFPVKLKLTFTNTSDKPIKLNAYALPYRIKFQCDGPSPDSIRKLTVDVDLIVKSPTKEDYPVLQPGKSWSPNWTPCFPGDIPDGYGKVVGYILRQPGTYTLRMTLYENLRAGDEAQAEQAVWLESNELELKVREKE